MQSLPAWGAGMSFHGCGFPSARRCWELLAGLKVLRYNGEDRKGMLADVAVDAQHPGDLNRSSSGAYQSPCQERFGVASVRPPKRVCRPASSHDPRAAMTIMSRFFHLNIYKAKLDRCLRRGFDNRSRLIVLSRFVLQLCIVLA